MAVSLLGNQAPKNHPIPSRDSVCNAGGWRNAPPPAPGSFIARRSGYDAVTRTQKRRRPPGFPGAAFTHQKTLRFGRLCFRLRVRKLGAAAIDGTISDMIE